MINLHESMGHDQTRDPWICSQTHICCQTCYRLRYAARLFCLLYRIKCILRVKPEVSPMRGSRWGILHHCALGNLNSMGSWCTNLSNYMGGWCLRKLNSMGGWVKKKVLSLGSTSDIETFAMSTATGVFME